MGWCLLLLSLHSDLLIGDWEKKSDAFGSDYFAGHWLKIAWIGEVIGDEVECFVLETLKQWQSHAHRCIVVWTDRVRRLSLSCDDIDNSCNSCGFDLQYCLVSWLSSVSSRLALNMMVLVDIAHYWILGLCAIDLGHCHHDDSRRTDLTYWRTSYRGRGRVLDSRKCVFAPKHASAWKIC